MAARRSSSNYGYSPTQPSLYEIQTFPIDVVEVKSNGTKAQRRLSLEHVVEYILDWIRFEPAAGIRIRKSVKAFEFVNEVGSTSLTVICGSRNMYILDVFVFLIEHGTPDEFPTEVPDLEDYIRETYPWEDVQDFKRQLLKVYPELQER